MGERKRGRHDAVAGGESRADRELAPDIVGIAGVDRTIHEPSRLLIVALLSAVEQADFLFLLRETGLTKGNLSSHLTKLEAAAFISMEKRFEGKKPLTLVALTEKGASAYRDYRARMGAFLKSQEKDV